MQSSHSSGVRLAHFRLISLLNALVSCAHILVHTSTYCTCVKISLISQRLITLDHDAYRQLVQGQTGTIL